MSLLEVRFKTSQIADLINLWIYDETAVIIWTGIKLCLIGFKAYGMSLLKGSVSKDGIQCQSLHLQAYQLGPSVKWYPPLHLSAKGCAQKFGIRHCCQHEMEACCVTTLLSISEPSGVTD